MIVCVIFFCLLIEPGEFSSDADVEDLLSSQCLRHIDGVATSNYDYLYRDGHVVSVEEEGLKNLSCIPELNGRPHPDDVSCRWWQNGTRLKLFPSYSEQYFADEPKNCILYTEFSALSFSRTRNIFENFSCETQTTVMRYELYLEDKTAVVGSDPLVSLENTNSTIRRGEGKTLDVTCLAYMGLSSAVIKLDWYLMTKAGMVDITSLPAHSVSNCAVTHAKQELRSTLRISNMTENLYNNTYRCVASKVDIPSVYKDKLSTLTLHTSRKGGVNYTGLIPLPNETSLNVSWLRYYDNDTNACSLRSPCTGYISVELKAPFTVPIPIGIYVAIGVVLTLCCVICAVALAVYLNIIPVLNSLKHQWGVTKDLVNSDFRYNAALFYAQDIESEELFVQNEFLVKLENNWQYKLYLPPRDAAIGSNVAQENVDVIECSQKTIFLLTQEMLTQDWVIYALDVALADHRKIIIIEREPIDFQPLIEHTERQYHDVGCALKVADVVKWDVKDKYRWQRIHVSMPALVTSTSIKHRITAALRGRLLKSCGCI